MDQLIVSRQERRIAKPNQSPPAGTFSLKHMANKVTHRRFTTSKALHNIAKKWTMPIPHWSQAMQAFAIIFEGRVPTLDGNSFTQFI